MWRRSIPSSPARCADTVRTRSLTILSAGLLAGILAFGTAYWWRTREHRQLLASPGSELAWLRHEFRLDDAQFARVAALHSAYRPTCADLCRRIAEQNRLLQEAALRTNVLTPAVAALVAETGKVRDECRAAMLAHLYAVSREMSPEEGRRYLELMLTETCVVQAPHTIQAVHSQHDHRAP